MSKTKFAKSGRFCIMQAMGHRPVVASGHHRRICRTLNLMQQATSRFRTARMPGLPSQLSGAMTAVPPAVMGILPF